MMKRNYWVFAIFSLILTTGFNRIHEKTFLVKNSNGHGIRIPRQIVRNSGGSARYLDVTAVCGYLLADKTH